MPTPVRRFLVLHGWMSRRPRGHWHWQLVEALRSDGEQVLYPQLPDPEAPSLAAWTDLLHAELAQLGTAERVVVAHSLSVPLWLHAAASLRAEQRVDRVLLVAPPSPRELARFPEVAEFAAVDLEPAAVAAAAASTRLVAAVDDPWCPEGAAVAYAGLGLDADVLPHGGHLSPDHGYGAWPAVRAWCRDPATRLTPR